MARNLDTVSVDFSVLCPTLGMNREVLVEFTRSLMGWTIRAWDARTGIALYQSPSGQARSFATVEALCGQWIATVEDMTGMYVRLPLSTRTRLEMAQIAIREFLSYRRAEKGAMVVEIKRRDAELDESRKTWETKYKKNLMTNQSYSLLPGASL